MRRMLRPARIFGFFANNRTIAQLSGDRDCHAITDIQSFGNFKALAALIFRLSCGPNFVFTDLIAAQ